jgi:hypothetical protein
VSGPFHPSREDGQPPRPVLSWSQHSRMGLVGFLGIFHSHESLWAGALFTDRMFAASQCTIHAVPRVILNYVQPKKLMAKKLQTTTPTMKLSCSNRNAYGLRSILQRGEEYQQKSNMSYRMGRACWPIPNPMSSKIMGFISTANQAIPEMC